MKTFLIIIIIIILIPNVYSEIIFSEIMYNPEGSDSGHEWIEIYNNGSQIINIEGWKFFEDNTKHSLTQINSSYLIAPGVYCIIADEWDTFLSDYPGFKGCLFDSSWSSLYNSGEHLSIIDDNLVTIDEINYSTKYADGNGKSLSRLNNTWLESLSIGGTPGEENDILIIEDPIIDNQTETQSNGLSLEINIDEIVYIGLTYTSLFKVRNLDHVSGTVDSINLTIGYNISFNGSVINSEVVDISNLNSYKTSNTGRFTPQYQGIYRITGWIINSSVQDNNYNDNSDSQQILVIDTISKPCDITINISTDTYIIDEGESIKFKFKLNNESYPFTIEYWIEDYFQGIYKKKYNTTNTNQKTWKTSIEEQDRILFIKSLVYPYCNDTNISNNQAQEMFIVVGNKEETYSNEESSLKIVDFDDEASFGDTVEVKVEIYKGDTNKYSISLWIEDDNRISEISKIHLYDKYSSFNGKLPIQLKPNCNKKYEDGKYDLVIEGLGLNDKQKIKVEGTKSSLCKTTTKTITKSETSSPQKKFEYEIRNLPLEIDSNKIDCQVELTNNDDENMNIKIWGYLYRGNKCYSGEREENLKELILEKNSKEIIDLTNNLPNIEPGEYNYKVVINKNNQKTNYELKDKITIKSKSKVSESLLLDQPNNQEIQRYTPTEQRFKNNNLDTRKLPKTVYLSTDQKAKNLIPYLIIFILITLCIFLIFLAFINIKKN